jgi:Ser/Thr protein kinase RdoA (MazF antagonist)
VEPRLENSSERRPDAREHDAPKDRDKNRKAEAGRIHQDVKQQNVHDDRGEDRQCEGHESINQEQSARNQLERKNRRQIV